MNRFYEVGPLGEIAINLFHGYGYNFYRLENQLRADDQRVREMACTLLGRARAAVGQAESLYRRERFPAPTRAQPFPPPEIILAARTLEQIGRDIGGLEGQVRHQSVPENGRMTQRYHQEAATLERLADKDKLLIGQAETLRTLVENVDGEALLDRHDSLSEGITAIRSTLQERQALLF